MIYDAEIESDNNPTVLMPGGNEMDKEVSNQSNVNGSAFLFDLDGTLVDSVYQHVLAWRETLEEAGIELAVWRIHRQIGMSGGLFVNALQLRQAVTWRLPN
jgi:hypothetical protein